MTLQARFTQDQITEIGIDEAGRGSFWGPLMAGAVVLPQEWTEEQRAVLIQLRDSKKISPKKRVLLEAELRKQIPLCGVGIVMPNEINDQGITWANREAFRRAMGSLNIPLEGCRLLIDGILPIDTWKGDQHVIIEGDNQYIAIAAASILAKVAHDKWIHEFCEANPECNERYDLLRSNGYGTARHREGIRLYGGHELHRDMYIQNWLPGSSHKEKKKTKKSDVCLIQFTK
jgi:ribonuclease HII